MRATIGQCAGNGEGGIGRARSSLESKESLKLLDAGSNPVVPSGGSNEKANSS